MVIELKCGETVYIRFKDTDGEIQVTYDEKSLRVKADMEDPSGRGGVIYEEKWVEADSENK